MNGFQIRRENKKADIINAAYQLFLTGGIKNISIAEIAKKAKVSQVSIYNFFESKENLARQVFIKMMEDIMDDLETLEECELSFQEKVDKMRSMSIEAGNHSNQLINQSELMKDPLIHKFLDEIGENITIPFFMRLIEQGRAEGYLDNDISTESILIYINSINKALRSDLNQKVRSDLGKLFFNGLFGKMSDTHPAVNNNPVSRLES